MIDSKAWYQSKTVWGALIAVAASVLRLAGVELGLDMQGQLADAAVTLAGTIGGLLALYGRVAAKAAIGK
ncbi:MAG: hypothetical protein ACOH2J_02690 [Allorhizobium sp.]